MKLNKKKLFRWIKVLLLLYGSIGIALYYLQTLFLFHPGELPRSYAYAFDVPFKEVEMPFSPTDTLNMVQFYPKDSLRKGVVLYFHGNRQNINRYAKFAANFTKLGYEVWMPDYPGFGKSRGDRGERNLYYQAEEIYKLATRKYGADSIILYGKSFGTGIAAYLAASKRARQLVLETPYSSIPDLFSCYAPIYPTSRMSTYKIPTQEYLAATKIPVAIFHGTGDWVIPYRCAAKLKPALKASDVFITIPQGTHHNLNDFDSYHRSLDSILRH